MLISFRVFKDFRDDESGVATVWALSWLILCFAIAGLSIDITNAWKVRQFLQSTADVSAHAAAVELGQHSNADIETAVRFAANSYATANMNTAAFGDVLLDNDIHVGYWDNDAKLFTMMQAGDTEIPTAVRVSTRQDGTDGASARVGTFFLRFVWKDSFKISTMATVERFVSKCERDGMFANGVISGSALQHITRGYCWHGEAGITFAQEHIFDSGTIAGTADISNCGPSSTSCTNEHNPGVEEALRVETQLNPKVDRISEYIADYLNPLSDAQPDYINFPAVHTIADPANFNPAIDLIAGRVNVINCDTMKGQPNISLGVPPTGAGQSGTSSGEANTQITLSDFVLVGKGCDFVFDQTVSYKDVVIVTDSTGNQTFSGSAGVVLGADDNCTQGGEVVLITEGSVKFAAQLEAYDIEVVAAGNLSLASAGGTESIHEGSNFYVGGDVSITAQHTFAGCDTVPVQDTKWSFRIVE